MRSCPTGTESFLWLKLSRTFCMTLVFISSWLWRIPFLEGKQQNPPRNDLFGPSGNPLLRQLSLVSSTSCPDFFLFLPRREITSRNTRPACCFPCGTAVPVAPYNWKPLHQSSKPSPSRSNAKSIVFVFWFSYERCRGVRRIGWQVVMDLIASNSSWLGARGILNGVVRPVSVEIY